MTDDKRTKAEILEALESAESARERAESAAYRAQNSASLIPPERIPEADALAACVRALEPLTKNRSTGGYQYSSYGIEFPRPQTDIERILRSLAARYGVPIIEVRTDPCTRKHVDEISADRIMQAIHS